MGWVKGLSRRGLRSSLQGEGWGALLGLSVGSSVTQPVLCRVGFLEGGASMELLSAQDGEGRGRSRGAVVSPLRPPHEPLPSLLSCVIVDK